MVLDIFAQKIRKNIDKIGFLDKSILPYKQLIIG